MSSDDEGYKYLEVLEMDKIKEGDMKDQFTREYKRRFKLVLRPKLNGKNKMMMMMTMMALSVY